MKKQIFGIGIVGVLLGVTFLYNPSCLAKVLIEKNNDLPVTVFNITFESGSASDPRGQEGLAYLTARSLREGGVKEYGGLPARTRAELEEVLFPLSADIGVSVGKEQTSFSVTSTAENAELVFGLLSQILMAPALDEGEFKRIQREAVLSLEKRWPSEDQEELGKAALDQIIYGDDHPYAHVVDGTTAGVKAITIETVKNSYQKLFNKDRLVLGITGVISDKLAKQAKLLNESLPAAQDAPKEIPKVGSPASRTLTIVEGEFEATGVHLGQPLPITRASEDFPALYLANIAYGKHRAFVGRLMRIVREIRGLNYGTYSYVEDFPRGGRLLIEPTQVARRQQAFTVWGRPTTVENGCFLLRMLTRETESLAKNGITEAEFKSVQGHLVGNVPLLATGIARRLGFSIDSSFYGIDGDYLSGLQKNIQDLSFDKVNDTVKKYLDADKLHMVVVTKDSKKFIDSITGERCDITYGPGVEKPQEILEEDKKIAVYDVGVKAEAIKVVKAKDLFAK